MNRDVIQGQAARDKLLDGLNAAADIIKTTMGPLGNYVTIDLDKYTWPLTTNDGATVANAVQFKELAKNTGAKYVRQAAQKTNDVAGDGTTTASVLTQAIIAEGLKLIGSGVSPVELRRGIESATASVLKDLQKQSKKIEQKDVQSLIDIATISCRDEKLGSQIATLVSEIGADGVISIEDSALHETTVERTEGLEVRGGLLSTYFVNHRAFQQAVYEETPVIVTDYALTTQGEVVRLMEELNKAGKKKAVLIAAQVEGMALQTIIHARMNNLFDMLPLRVIAYGPIGEGYMRDICAATNSTFITDKDGRKITDFTSQEAGLAQKVIAGAHKITFIGGAGDSSARVEELIAQVKNVKDLEEESIRERIAKLQSKTASIKVGGVTDSSREEVKKRVEDAVNATKAALSEGIVTGGGSALFRAGSSLQSADYGSRVVAEACKYPLRQIAKNSAVELDRGKLETITNDPKKTYDFRTGEVVNAFEKGIIDPAKVVMTALANAAAQAVLFLITDGIIVTAEDDGQEL